jgi:hypothetical protein
MKSNRTRRIAAASVLSLALGATSLVVAPATSGAATPPACTVKNDDHWAPRVQGEPKGINPKTSAATYMWHDADGWHVRVTHHTTNLKSFSGQITTTGTFGRAKPVRLEKADSFAVSADRHSLTFLFKNHGYVDGVDFKTRCAPSVKFAFQSDGKATPRSRIVIGRNNVHPKHNPFTINRTSGAVS